jgi:hypothetical protein
METGRLEETLCLLSSRLLKHKSNIETCLKEFKMKRLVFNFVFCLLLMTAFVFVATPAMAIVEITVTGEYTDDDGNTATNERKIVVQLKYNEVPDPKPTAADIALTPSTSVTFGEGDDDNSKTYFITWSDLQSGVNGEFTLTGYMEVTAEGTTDSNNNPIVNFTGLTRNKLTHDPTYLPGLGYAIIAANSEAIASGVLPTLPRIASPNDIIKVQWGGDDGVSDEPTMPDLYALFEGGGSLNLRVNEPGSENRLRSKKDDGTYDDNSNQRQVVINEVMWAHDQSYFGDPERLVGEQWIELYNRGTTPIAFSDMEFTTSKEFPGPDPETDLLSNVPSFEITWEIGNLGQHGSSQTPRREFKSMQRVNYDNGWESGHWSIASSTFLRSYRGTPGKENRATRVPTARKKPSKDNPAKSKIIINEIGNFAADELDWIELRNVTGSAQSLKEWVLTKTTGFGNEDEIVRFPDKSIPARGVLLLVNKDPSETLLTAGFDIKVDANSQALGAGPHRYLIVDENKLQIPNDDKWLLMLRSNKPWDVGDDEEDRDVYQTGHRVEDVAGPGALHDDFKVLDLRAPSPNLEKKSNGKPGKPGDGDVWNTKVFPLNGNTQADKDFLQDELLNTADKVWIRDGDKQGYLKDAWDKVGFTGIGYDRRVQSNDQHSGTPGYDNSVAKGKVSQLDGGKLIISELMLTTRDKRFPQWIELYNTSKTRGIDLAADSSDPKTGWQLIIENHDSGSWKEDRRRLSVTVDLKDLFNYSIPPNQTVLITAFKGRVSEKDHFPAARVASIADTKMVDFGIADRKDIFLNAEGGFNITIVDSDGTISDEVGNLDFIPTQSRAGSRRIEGTFDWSWSTALTEEGTRTSLIRMRDRNGRPRIAVPDRRVEGDITGAVLPLGVKNRPPKYAWVHAVDTAFKRVPEIWYGSDDDVSTPGFIKGTPLPVALSFFRPTLENGEIVIRWTTESEIDNAGFNILRSNNRNGEYKQINTELIQGAGTAGERNTYKWIDPTAKTGVVYYYQIEDVSFAGEHNLLTTARLKGFISAKNKLTTTWSELKRAR